MMVTHELSADFLLQLERAAPHDRESLLRAHGDDALHLLIESAAAQTWKDARQSLAMTQIVLDLAVAIGNPADRAMARWARSRALAAGARFDEAAALCRLGILEARQAHLPVLAGRLQLVLMQALGELGRLDDAIAAGKEAQLAFLASNQPDLAARADINIGIAHLRRGQPRIAVACFDHARPFFSADPLILGHLENSRGEALLALDDFNGAQSAYAAALLAFQSGGALLAQAIAEGNLAELAARQGHLQLSLFHFERARRALEADAAPGQLARLLAEQADALQVLGMPAEALREYQAALPELERCGLTLEAARARSGMGHALVRLNRLSDAETALAAAAKALDELGHASARARVDLVRAQIAARNGRISQARSIVLRVLPFIDDHPTDVAAARLLLARFALDSADVDLADAELAAGMSVARQLDLAPLLADALHLRGRIRLARADAQGAAADLSSAIAQYERVRDTLQADRLRAAYLGDRQGAYELLVLAHLHAGDVSLDHAFAAVELAKSRGLLEQVRRSVHIAAEEPPPQTDAIGPPFSADLESRRATLSALYSRLPDVAASSAHRDQLRSLVQNIRTLEDEIDALERRLSATRGIGSFFVPTSTVHQVRARLNPQTALIEFFSIADELLAFVVRHDRTVAVRNLGCVPDIAALVDRVHFQMNRALRPGPSSDDRNCRLLRDARRELASLHDRLLAPLLSHLAHARRLILVPHGPLHAAPLAALWDGRRYLIESFELLLAPSASLWARLQIPADPADQADRPSALAPVVLGVADEFAPEIEAEASAVARMLNCDPSRLLLGSDGSLAALRTCAPLASILHLACHGRFIPESPLAGGLRLADGWLTVRHMLDLQLNADLVALSGCETGVSRISAGDELSGLLRSVLAAGALNVLASLWRVDDLTTRQFMVSFYSALNGADPVRALRDAQLSRIRLPSHAQHPAFWAAFMLTGGNSCRGHF